MVSKTLKFLVLIFVVLRLSFAKNCTCVPFYQCSDDEDGFIINDGRGLIEIREFAECENLFDVCCNTTIPATTRSPIKLPQGCGTHHSDTFPWTSSLLYQQQLNSLPSYKCRVSLIHQEVAITAAHCLDHDGHYQVRIGSTIRIVTHIHKHPSFKQESLQNDIAVLILNKPFRMDKIGTVCIPAPETIVNGTNCTTSNTKKDGSVSVITLPMVETNRCEEILRESRLGKFFHLHESFICAGGDVEDTCNGDGGSALICPIAGLQGRYQQVGIVSWGIGCRSNTPGVYVNLSHFRKWIDEVMLQSGFDLLSYRV